MEGELLLIGVIAIIGAFIYYKLDLWMQLHEKTNKLIEKLIDEKENKTEKKEKED
jgi:dolichol kinase